MKTIKWLDRNLELMILAILLAIMSVLSFANVIMRYGFHNAIGWSDEVCCYCLALSAFFALPCAIRLGTTIKVDTFTVLLPKPVQKVLEILCSAGMVVFLGWLLAGNYRIIGNAASVGQASPALGIPIANLYTIMAAAIALAILRYLQFIVRTVTGKVDEEEKPDDETSFTELELGTVSESETSRAEQINDEYALLHQDVLHAQASGETPAVSKEMKESVFAGDMGSDSHNTDGKEA